MKPLILLTLCLVAPVTLRAQIFRIDPVPVYTTATNIPPGNAAPMLAIPGATIQLCADLACMTPALTYTSAAGAVSCPINAQVTLPTSALCQSTSGPQGEFGFWVQAGTYYYMITLPNGTVNGPYPVSSTQQAGGGQTFSIPGVFNHSTPTTTEWIAVNGLIGLTQDFNTQWLQMSNLPNYRPVAVNGWNIVPPNVNESSIVYEADGVAGVILAGSPNVNSVALSGFAFPTQDSPFGTASQSGNTLTRLTGPSFDSSWCPDPAGFYVNTIFYVNGANNFCTVFIDANHMTLASAATLTNVAWAKQTFLWGINTAVSDGLSGLTYPNGYKYISMTGWENDVNIYETTSNIIGASGGGGSLVNPNLSIDWLNNTLGPGPGLDGYGIRWQTAFGSLPGTADAFASIAPVLPVGPSGSAPISIFSYTSAGYAIDGTLFTASNGDFNISVGGGSTHGENPHPLVLLDAAGTLILGCSGGVGVDHAVCEMGTNSQLQPGSATLSQLNAGGGGGAAMMYCSNCQNVIGNSITAGSVCVAGGTGAWAVHEPGGWVCL